MCKAWDDHKLSGRREGLIEGREEGREEGRVKGREEGRIETTIEFVRKLNKYGMVAKEIAAALELSETQVRSLLKMRK